MKLQTNWLRNFRLEVEKLTVGDPFENKDITPVIDEQSAVFIEGLVQDAQSKGAVELTSYKREKNLIWPTLLNRSLLRWTLLGRAVRSSASNYSRIIY